MQHTMPSTMSVTQLQSTLLAQQTHRAPDLLRVATQEKFRSKIKKVQLANFKTEKAKFFAVSLDGMSVWYLPVPKTKETLIEETSVVAEAEPKAQSKIEWMKRQIKARGCTLPTLEDEMARNARELEVAQAGDNDFVIALLNDTRLRLEEEEQMTIRLKGIAYNESRAKAHRELEADYLESAQGLEGAASEPEHRFHKDELLEAAKEKRTLAQTHAEDAGMYEGRVESMSAEMGVCVPKSAEISRQGSCPAEVECQKCGCVWAPDVTDSISCPQCEGEEEDRSPNLLLVPYAANEPLELARQLFGREEGVQMYERLKAQIFRRCGTYDYRVFIPDFRVKGYEGVLIEEYTFVNGGFNKTALIGHYRVLCDTPDVRQWVSKDSAISVLDHLPQTPNETQLNFGARDWFESTVIEVLGACGWLEGRYCRRGEAASWRTPRGDVIEGVTHWRPSAKGTDEP